MAVQPAAGPSPRPRISRGFIEDHRRRRCVDATAEILHEFGRGGLSVTAILGLTGTARNTFYKLFVSIDECVDYGIDLAEAELFTGLEELDGEAEWRAELAAGIGGFFERVAAKPLLAGLYLIHSSGFATDAAQTASLTAGERFVPLLSRGRDEAEALGRSAPSPLVDECLSRTITSLAARRVLDSEADRLPAESGEIAMLAAEYYTGRRDPS
jgi:AcrR family transcriptional regulator